MSEKEKRSLKDWDPREVVEHPERFIDKEEVVGAFSKEIVVRIAEGGVVTLSIGGEPIGLLTKLNLEAVVAGELGNVKKFEVEQMKIVDRKIQREGFLSIEEFIEAQGIKPSESDQKGDSDDN